MSIASGDMQAGPSLSSCGKYKRDEGGCMPKVGGKKYPYTPAGLKAAKKAATKRKKTPMKKAR
jgi:hypothetical protein